MRPSVSDALRGYVRLCACTSMHGVRTAREAYSRRRPEVALAAQKLTGGGSAVRLPMGRYESAVTHPRDVEVLRCEGTSIPRGRRVSCSIRAEWASSRVACFS